MNKNSFWLGMFLGGIAGTVICLKGRNIRMSDQEQEISYTTKKTGADSENLDYSASGTETDYSTGDTYREGENNYNRQQDSERNYIENISSMFNFEEKLNKLEKALEDLKQTIGQE